jgi:predicted deacylase
MNRPLEIDIRPLDLERFPRGQRVDLRAPLYEDGLGNPLYCPLVVARGSKPGPVVGLCAAVHGDELNGIKIIHSILKTIDMATLHGTLLCAPIVNIPAFQAEQRRFPEDNRDLNSMFPGKANGLPSEQYARSFLTVFLGSIEYLVDIHTASAGRINSMYVRADLHSPEAREMAMLMNPEIILHGRSGDGTLRSAARKRGIHAITVEAGNPSEFQGSKVERGEIGILNMLKSLGMWHGSVPALEHRTPVVCSKSIWIRTKAGGLLDCGFKLTNQVHKGQALATLSDPYGHVTGTYRAPGDGVVIGMSRRPVAVPGTRFCHLGTIGEP